jgi:hypothetical protein
MKLFNTLTVALVALFVSTTGAFTAPSFGRSCSRSQVSLASTMADSGVPPTTSEDSSNVEDFEIPTKLPSDVGMDYVPLATMLATGQLAEADQVCLLCIFSLARMNILLAWMNILVNLDRIGSDRFVLRTRYTQSETSVSLICLHFPLFAVYT